MKTFLEITGMVLQVLQQWFQEDRDGYQWDGDPMKSKIEIAPAFLWTPEVTQVRPGIYVKRDMWTPKGMSMRSGLDDLMTLRPAGDDTHLYMPAAQLSVLAIGKHAGEVEVISTSVSEVLMGLGPVLRKEFNLIAFDLEQVSGIQKTEEYKEMWVISHAVSVKYHQEITLKEFSPKIKRILIDSYPLLFQEVQS